jgi:hypothetical protein
VRSWQYDSFSVGSFQLAVFSWQLAGFSWQLAGFSFQLAGFSEQLAVFSWQFLVGSMSDKNSRILSKNKILESCLKHARRRVSAIVSTKIKSV